MLKRVICLVFRKLGIFVNFKENYTLKCKNKLNKKWFSEKLGPFVIFIKHYALKCKKKKLKKKSGSCDVSHPTLAIKQC